ncbi:hypothetical protein ACLB1Q_34800 [Escherichia coli]
MTDAAGVERKKPAEIDPVEGSVTVQVANTSHAMSWHRKAL